MGMSFSDLQGIAKEAGFSNVPDGEYEAEVKKAEAKPTKAGKDMIVVQFKIIPTAMNDTKGTVFNNFVISPESPNAVAFFFRHMAALGLGQEYFAANPDIEDVANALVGRRCRVTVGTREWNGQERNEVKSIKPSDQVNSDPMANNGPVAAPVESKNQKVNNDPMANVGSGPSDDPEDPFG